MSYASDERADQVLWMKIRNLMKMLGQVMEYGGRKT